MPVMKSQGTKSRTSRDGARDIDRLHDFLQGDAFEQLTNVRVEDPERAYVVARKRKRRLRLTTDGKLTIVACDHPARKVVRAGDSELAMADRQDLLKRIVRILADNAADGVMGTMDLLSELLILEDLFVTAGGDSFLNEKLMIASLNRGGLSGAVWELDDPMTGPAPVACREWNLDAVKLLLRLCDEDPASLKTLKYCADAIASAGRVKMPVFLEPLPVVRTDKGISVIKEKSELAKIVGVASALGETGQNIWLKLPYCKGFHVAAKATTMPILLLGGDSTDESDRFIENLQDGLNSHHNVRGTMIGRNILFPSSGDPVSAARRIYEVVHARAQSTFKLTRGH